MSTYIQCEVLAGMFSSEYTLKVVDASGVPSSLFCPREYVSVAGEPDKERGVIYCVSSARQEG